MSRPSTPRPRRDDRMPPFLGMLGALVVGGIVGAFGGLWAGARLAPLLGLSESAGTAALFVTFAALPLGALSGAALALVALFRVVRSAPHPPPVALLALAALGGGLVAVTAAAPKPDAPARAATTTSQPAGGTAMQLTSPAFAEGAAIPARHTSDGPDVAPPLQWSHAPAGTKSFVLIVDDPDAPDPAHPKMTWVHWVLYDIPADAQALPEAADDKTLPKGARNGQNDWKATGYRGPSPPIGRHRYFFKLYALDTTLGDLKRPTKATLEPALKGHVLAQAELMGTYEKKR